MMSPRDPDAGQFSALLRDIAEVQARRGSPSTAHFGKALQPDPRPSRRAAIPFSAHPAARRIMDGKATRAGIEKTSADMAALTRQLQREAAAITGERRAEIRAQVRDVLNRAMEGNATGAITAIEVAHIEAECGRVLARLEPGPALVRGVA